MRKNQQQQRAVVFVLKNHAVQQATAGFFGAQMTEDLDHGVGAFALGGIDALGLEQRYQRAVVEPLPETVLVLQRASTGFCHYSLVAREVEQTVYRGVHRHIGAQLDRQHIVEYRAVGVGKHQRGIEPTQ